MNSHEEGPPLSVGYLSPGWPPEAFANGIISYVADMADQLRKMGHRVTILANKLGGGGPGEGVYDVEEGRSTRGLLRRAMDSLGYRIAPDRMARRFYSRNLLATLRRAIPERDIQLLEIEESFGWGVWLQRAVSIPVCIRIHGPWFLNGAAVGVAEDEVFRKRGFAREGRALERAYAVTAPSRDVLERTRDFYGLPLEHAEVIPVRRSRSQRTGDGGWRSAIPSGSSSSAGSTGTRGAT